MTTKGSDDGFTPRTTLRISSSPDLAAYLASELRQSMANQWISPTPAAEAYLGGILMRFLSPEALHDRAEGRASHRPLTELYAEAALGKSGQERYHAYHRLGDIALFMSGFFSARVRQGVMGEGYYVAMGRNAYARTATLLQARSGQKLAALYGELAHDFPRFRNAFEEVGDRVQIDGDRSLVRLCERLQDPSRVKQMLVHRGMLISGKTGTA